jgi:hypothetical protein
MLGKTYGTKRVAIQNMLGGTPWKFAQHVKNPLGTQWQHIGRLMGTQWEKKKKKNSNIPHFPQKEKFGSIK